MVTYAGDALPEWPNGGLGGAVPAGWQSSKQHGSGPDMVGSKDSSLYGILLTWTIIFIFPIPLQPTYDSYNVYKY